MTQQRRAAWKGAIRKSRRGEPVSPEEHYALLREGLFKGLGTVDAEEEARYVVRYLLSGEDLSDIAPRGPREAQNWFAMREEWGAKRQTQKLRNMIAGQPAGHRLLGRPESHCAPTSRGTQMVARGARRLGRRGSPGNTV